MKRAQCLMLACFFWSVALLAEASDQSRGFWSCGNLKNEWDRMDTFERCVAAIVIPPGYVIGICTKSIAWLFAGQREF